jgi:hypothetical protein
MELQYYLGKVKAWQWPDKNLMNYYSAIQIAG